MRSDIERIRFGERLSEAGRVALAARIQFGSVEIVPCARTLLVDGVEATIGGRAFDLLLLLLEAKGGIVPKEEIVRRVWPTVTVIDSNVKVQVSLLRRALGLERWRLKTISGRGWLLVADHPASAVQPPLQSERWQGADRPLIIVVETHPSARDCVMRAMSDLATSCAGVTRLSLL